MICMLNISGLSFLFLKEKALGNTKFWSVPILVRNSNIQIWILIKIEDYIG